MLEWTEWERALKYRNPESRVSHLKDVPRVQAEIYSDFGGWVLKVTASPIQMATEVLEKSIHRSTEDALGRANVLSSSPEFASAVASLPRLK